MGQQWYPAPRRPLSYIRKYYSHPLITCFYDGYSHEAEDFTKEYKISRSCVDLLAKYAFVQYCFDPNGGRDNTPVYVEEHLSRADGKSVHRIRTIMSSSDVRYVQAGYVTRPATFEC